jgi:hypothetical protein
MPAALVPGLEDVASVQVVAMPIKGQATRTSSRSRSRVLASAAGACSRWA